MAIDVSELLMADTDEAPSDSVSGNSTTPKRGRGRPKGSTTRKGGTSPAPRLTGTRELAQLFAKALGGASVLVELFIDLQGVAMTPQEANEISRPLARIVARTGLGEWLMRLFGAQTMGGDYGKLAWALTMYGLRVYPLIVQRQEQLAAQRQAQKGRPFGQPGSEDARVRSGQPVPQATSNGNGAGNGHSAGGGDDAARAAADAARWGGLGFVDPDALAAGAHGDVAAIVRAYPAN